MKEYKIYANLDFSKDTIRLDEDLTDEEVEKELFNYLLNFFDWNYEEVKDDTKI